MTQLIHVRITEVGNTGHKVDTETETHRSFRLSGFALLFYTQKFPSSNLDPSTERSEYVIAFLSTLQMFN
jgi:hypothetical protein